MTRSSPPRVSVVIATHNRADLLPACVESIRQQTLQDLEIVVVDDASSDRTPEVLEELRAADPRVRPVRAARNLGPGGARNLGAREARAPLIAVLDDDDRSLPTRLEKQAGYLDQRPEVDGLFTAIRWHDAAGVTLRHVTGPILADSLPRDPGELFELLYLDSNRLTSTTLMIRRDALLEEPYAEDVRVGEDWSMFLRLSARGRLLRSIPESLVDMQRDAGHASLMSDKARAFADQRRVLRQIRAWLRQCGIRDFDSLHRRAWARQLVREARFWYGARALALIGRALLSAPRDREPWRAVAWLGGVARAKARRLVGPPGGAEGQP